MQFHNQCDDKYIAQYAIIPGAHSRANKIAERLEKAKYVPWSYFIKNSNAGGLLDTGLRGQDGRGGTKLLSRKRRKLSPELKVDAVKELLTGAKTAVEICRERDITDKLLYRWKTELLDYLTPAEFAAAYLGNNSYSLLSCG